MRLLLIALVLCGCARTERSRALAQADQAVTAIQQECKAQEPSVPKIQTLAITAKASIAPSLEDVKVPTTVDMALNETPKFVHMATKQAGKAESETNDWSMIIESSGLEALLLGALAGLSPIAAVFGKRVLDNLRTKRKADQDQVAYAEEITYAKTDEEIKAVQDKHYARQMKNGTHKVLYERRKQ